MSNGSVLETLEAKIAALKEEEQRLVAEAEAERIRLKLAECARTNAFLLFMVQVVRIPYRGREGSPISYHRTREGAQKACDAFNQRNRDDPGPSMDVCAGAFLPDEISALVKWKLLSD